MTIQWFRAAASAGKTSWVVDQARLAAQGLQETPRLVVPTRLLAGDLQRRLASRGGALGVWVGTLGDLVHDVLDKQKKYYLELSESMQRKLLQSLLQDLKLDHFHAIRAKPGFVQEALGFIRELKAGGITPEAFLRAAQKIEGEARLAELGRIFQAYQQVLRREEWADSAGLTWIAADTVGTGTDLWDDWGPVFLDGFDDLSPMQVRFVQGLSKHLSRCVFTLTGSNSGEQRPLVHKRFLRLSELLLDEAEVSLEQIEAELPAEGFSTPFFLELEAQLFESHPGQRIADSGELELIAVPDREAEVRTALGWIRRKIAQGKVAPEESALLMRSLEPYRGLVYRIAAEYDIPLRIQGGLPLAENPAVNSLWRWIQLVRQGREGLAWHDVLTTWRSPYLNWDCISSHPDGVFDLELHMEEARQLEEVARWGRVVRGYQQWEEAFQLLLDLEKTKDESDRNGTARAEELPGKGQGASLWEKFKKFVGMLEAPPEEALATDYAAWTLDLLGGTNENQSASPGLGVLARISDGPEKLLTRDWLAVSKFVELLKEYAAADQLLEGKPIPFRVFADELEGALRETSYQPRMRSDVEILCADCTEARGMPFKAVALIGLAEGEFPATIHEDPLLRDADRAILRDAHDLPLQPSTESAEAEYFYEAVLRASRFLLLTRPRIADNGAPWERSPYWEEIESLVEAAPRVLTAQSPVPLEWAASPAEYLEFLALRGRIEDSVAWDADRFPHPPGGEIQRARDIIIIRTVGDPGLNGGYDGNLSELSDMLTSRFPDDEIWSASRLESYQNCPFSFFVGSLLGLERIEPPEEGLDGRQLGNIYHRVLEDLYSEVGTDYLLSDLLQTLPIVAERVFSKAPAEEGFRETAWWQQTQLEILENLRLSLVVLEEIAPEYRFHSAEHRFGIGRSTDPFLVVDVPGQGAFRLRGLIDRVDRTDQGKVRIIDYKTGGPGGFDQRAVREGKKLQLPLYAMAAEQALGLGTVADGFYFHVQAAQPSGFQLAKFSNQGGTGPRAAMAAAAQHGWSAIQSIKQGRFMPHPPDAGCPPYCPAVDFCWKYQPRYW